VLSEQAARESVRFTDAGLAKMTDCCDVDAHRIRRGVLWIVLGVNLSLFVVALVAGVLAQSTAVLGDSLDLLGDSLVYGFTLYVLDRSVMWKARAAFIKGWPDVLVGGGIAVLFVQTAYTVVRASLIELRRA